MNKKILLVLAIILITVLPVIAETPDFWSLYNSCTREWYSVKKLNWKDNLSSLFQKFSQWHISI